MRKHLSLLLILLLAIVGTHVFACCETLEVPSTEKEKPGEHPDDTSDDVDDDAVYELVGDGTMDNPYSVSDVLHLSLSDNNTDDVWVRGYAVGSTRQSMSNAVFDVDGASETNLLLSDEISENDYKHCLPIELNTTELKRGLSLVYNAYRIGAMLMVKGDVMTYFRVNGLRNVYAWSWDGDDDSDDIDDGQEEDDGGDSDVDGGNDDEHEDTGGDGDEGEGRGDEDADQGSDDGQHSADGDKYVEDPARIGRGLYWPVTDIRQLVDGTKVLLVTETSGGQMVVANQKYTKSSHYCEECDTNSEGALEVKPTWGVWQLSHTQKYESGQVVRFHELNTDKWLAYKPNEKSGTNGYGNIETLDAETITSSTAYRVDFVYYVNPKDGKKYMATLYEKEMANGKKQIHYMTRSSNNNKPILRLSILPDSGVRLFYLVP